MGILHLNTKSNSNYLASYYRLSDFVILHTYGTGHMQRRTLRQAPASTRLKWVSHHTTLLDMCSSDPVCY